MVSNGELIQEVIVSYRKSQNRPLQLTRKLIPLRSCDLKWSNLLSCHLTIT